MTNTDPYILVWLANSFITFLSNVMKYCRILLDRLISPELYVALSYLRNSTNLYFTQGAWIHYFTFYVQILADV